MGTDTHNSQLRENPNAGKVLVFAASKLLAVVGLDSCIVISPQLPILMNMNHEHSAANNGVRVTRALAHSNICRSAEDHTHLVFEAHVL